MSEAQVSNHSDDVRLEFAIDIALGTVVRDSKTEVDYVYIGRTKNTKGYNYHFAPDRQADGTAGMTSTFAKLKSALQKFPDLEKYLIGIEQARSAAGEVQDYKTPKFG